MKKVCALLIILISFISTANSQAIKSPPLDEHAIIKDSSGIIYPYIIWKKMLSTGNYAIRKYARDSSFTIVKLAETEKDSRYSKMPKPAPSPFFTYGQKITSFSANDIDGKKIKLKDLLGKVVVLNFWFIGCPPCRMEIPELNKIAIKYANDPNVVFVAIALDARENDIRDYVKINPFGYHLINDGKMYADLYKIHLYPTNVVLDKQGKVVFHGSGYALNTPYWISKSIEEGRLAGM